MPGETGLVDIKRLVLSDTFNTWFDTTNQIIDAIDPVTVYGVQSLTGVRILDGASGGNYNGIKYFGVLPGHGVGYYGTNNEISLNYSGLSDGGQAIVATGDYFAFTDISDTTQDSGGTIKKVRAIDMLPSTVNAPNGNLTLEGNLSINGTLFVGGQNSFLASNDLRIEDKNIEIAFQQRGFLGATGITSGSYPTAGATAYYYDPGITSYGITSATVIGIVKSITGPNFGPTAIVSIGSVFTRGGPELFSLGGVIRFAGTNSIAGGPTGATYGIVSVFGDALSHFAVDGPTTEFFSDSNLDGAGITIRGASGDKTFVWSNSLKSLVSNVPVGVNSASNDGSLYVNTRYFRNNGLTSDGKNEFIFQGTSGNSSNTTLVVSYDSRAQWRFEHDKSVTGNEPLVIKHATGPAGPVITLSTINPLTTGPLGITTTAGGSANMWADGFNAEFLNGAGATFNSAAYSIPVSDSRGKINDVWLEASSNRTKITQSLHGLNVGQVVAVVGGSYTGANGIIYTSGKAEALGIIESVPDNNSFVLVTNGYITNVPTTVVSTTDEVYFMSTTVDGGLTTGEPTVTSSVRKPMFYPTVIAGGSASGYVLSYPGQVIGAGETATDQVYMESLVPVGSIQQYAGSYTNGNYNTNSWLPCDGRAVSYQSYTQLYDTIGNVYYARGIVTSSGGVSPVITLERDIRLIDPNDLLTVVVDNGTQRGGTSWAAQTVSVNSVNGTITLTADSISPGSTAWNNTGIGTSSFVRVYGKVDTLRPTTSVFFLPDLRTRISVGSVTGDNQMWMGDIWSPGASFNIEGNTIGYGVTGATSAIGGGFLATNYLIRAVKNTSALILTGHHHDDRYLLKTTSDIHSGSGITFAGSDSYYFGNLTGRPTLHVDNSSGYVGIGTTANSTGFGKSADRALDIVGTSTPALRVKATSGGGEAFFSVNNGTALDVGSQNNIYLALHTNATERMRIKTDGMVGVGTNNPAARLHVSTSLDEVIRAETTPTSNSGPYISLYRAGARQSYLAQQNLNLNLVNETSGGAIGLVTGGVTRMTIKSDGSVGIGTANAQDFLHIYAASPNIRLEDSGDNGGYSRIVANSAGGQTGSLILQADAGGMNSNAYMRFDVGTGKGVRAMQIMANGKIGLGTSTPDNTLTVAGGLKITPSGSSSLTGAFFTHPQFNSCSVTDISQNITLQSSLFADYGSPTSVYTIDPGAGIKITTGNTLNIATGFVWKII